MKLIYKLSMKDGFWVYCWVDKLDEKYEFSPHFTTKIEAETWRDKLVIMMKKELDTFDFDDWK